MCGIAGAFANSLTPEAASLVNLVVKNQINRGPDVQAVEKITTANSTLILGHNRLSIIDLSTKANQPMWDVDKRYCIVFNGEIYNYLELRSELQSFGYKFVTASDTEVALAAFKQWGIQAIEKFNGFFAIALFDVEREKLWLVRDRFGIKPLFYYLDKNVLYFSSATNTIASHFNLSPNLEYVARGLKYLVYEDDTDITPYTGIKAVPAAHYLEVNIEDKALKYRLTKYYDLQLRAHGLKEKIAHFSMPDLLEVLLEKLERAVTLRLRADVPVGISLSGGLDSSSIAAFMTRGKDSNAIGFTFGHPKEKKSEGPLVAALAKRCDLPVEYIWPTMTEFMQALPNVFQAQDAPFTTLSIIAQYLVYQKVRQTGVKVVLGGQGGDECFMGYRKFNIFRLRRLFSQKQYLQCFYFFLQLLPSVVAEAPQLKLYWSQRKRYANHNNVKTNSLFPKPKLLHLDASSIEETWLRQMSDVTKFSLPTLLRYEDRNSMAHSVESRLPFMDYELIEFGLALPETLKLRNGYGKWLLRQAIRGRIPEVIRSARYKRGFDVSQAALINAGFGKYLRELLNDNFTQLKDFLPEKQKITETFSDQRLMQDRSGVTEAISLLWLSGSYR